MAGKASKQPVLLSGGNPQIAKGTGDAPVQAYIAAIPGWKKDIGRRLDPLIARTVPGIRKAVKWNSPFYPRRPDRRSAVRRLGEAGQPVAWLTHVRGQP